VSRSAPPRHFDSDGWLHTGDVAAIDEDGYFRIVDRKKDIMINSAGKNMAPVPIEGAIKEQSPLIAFVAAIGDARQYVTALLALDPDGLERFAAENGLTGSYAELGQAPAVQPRSPSRSIARTPRSRASARSNGFATSRNRGFRAPSSSPDR
jgi:long-subunit acyl-CoA synthetase (AMP-forming)